MLEIIVPATSANIGSGFDSLGVAVNMHNKILMDSFNGIKIESADNAPIPTDEHNLIYKTARHLYEICGKEFSGLYIKQENNIPMARGLGSSSACIVAGLVGANKLMNSPMTQDQLVDIAAELEGHPDNSTPALLGGQVTAAMEDGKVYYTRTELKDDLYFATIIPNFELKTSLARQALPKEICHHQAVYNLSRAALMSTSLACGKYENLRVACQDKLHQPYRLSLIDGGEEVIDHCYKLGAYGAYISGAGSTLMGMVSTENKTFYEDLRGYLDQNGQEKWQLIMHKVENCGTQVKVLD